LQPARAEDTMPATAARHDSTLFALLAETLR